MPSFRKAVTTTCRAFGAPDQAPRRRPHVRKNAAPGFAPSPWYTRPSVDPLCSARRTPPRDFANLPRSPGRRDFAALARPRPAAGAGRKTAARGFGMSVRPSADLRASPRSAEGRPYHFARYTLLTFGKNGTRIGPPTQNKVYDMAQNSPSKQRNIYSAPLKEAVKEALPPTSKGDRLTWYYNFYSRRECSPPLTDVDSDSRQRCERHAHFVEIAGLTEGAVNEAASATREFNQDLGSVGLSGRGFTIQVSTETGFLQHGIKSDIKITIERVS